MSRPPVKPNARQLDDTGELVALLIERSAPDPKRPQLAPDREQRLAAVEQRSAACYAHAELLAMKLQRLATRIEATPPADAAPEPIGHNEDSVVLHLDELRSKTRIE